MYFAILFIPPVYFMARGKWGAFTVNSIFYGIAWLLLITLIGAAISPLFWLMSVGHAGWYFRQEMLEKHADMIASKMAAKLKE